METIFAEVLNGITMAMFAAVALFFFKFWRASRDRFFLLFSAAFALISAERFCVLFVDTAFQAVREVPAAGDWTYSLRLIGFLTILFAVYDKNRSKK